MFFSSQKTEKHPEYQSLRKEQREAKKEVSSSIWKVSLIKKKKKKNTRETLVTTGIHFVRVWGYNFYSLLLQHFQLNAWATGSLATDSAMMQDWRGTALQLHSAGEVGRWLLLQLFKAPLEVTVIKGTASHLTARKKKAARIHIKANSGNFYKRDTKISHASWNTVLRNINSNTDLPAQKCQSLPGTC